MTAMLKTGLEFAPGTTDECKRLIGRLFTPTELFGAYRTGRNTFKTSDLVLVAAENDLSGIEVQPRTAYVKKLREGMGAKAPVMLKALTLAQKSAHAVVQVPPDSDAMWLVVARGQQLPLMVVIFTTPYEVAAAGSEFASEMN